MAGRTPLGSLREEPALLEPRLDGEETPLPQDRTPFAGLRVRVPQHYHRRFPIPDRAPLGSMGKGPPPLDTDQPALGAGAQVAQSLIKGSGVGTVFGGELGGVESEPLPGLRRRRKRSHPVVESPGELTILPGLSARGGERLTLPFGK